MTRLPCARIGDLRIRGNNDSLQLGLPKLRLRRRDGLPQTGNKRGFFLLRMRDQIVRIVKFRAIPY
jgi:hypothetical protein